MHTPNLPTESTLRLADVPDYPRTVPANRFSLDDLVAHFGSSPWSDLRPVMLWASSDHLTRLGDIVSVQSTWRLATGATRFQFLPASTLTELDALDSVSAKHRGDWVVLPQTRALAQQMEISDRFEVAGFCSEYVVDCRSVIEMAGPAFSEVRRSLRKAAILATESVPIDKVTSDEIMQVALAWDAERHRRGLTPTGETAAIRKLLGLIHPQQKLGAARGLGGSAFLVDDQVIAFDINDTVDQDLVIGLFWKSLPGAGLPDSLIYHRLCAASLQHGRTRLNIGCDLGSPGLRRYKQYWNPTEQLLAFTPVTASER